MDCYLHNIHIIYIYIYIYNFLRLSHEELRNGVHLFLSANKPEEEINKLIS